MRKSCHTEQNRKSWPDTCRASSSDRKSGPRCGVEVKGGGRATENWNDKAANVRRKRNGTGDALGHVGGVIVLVKGKQVYTEGRLQTREWTGKHSEAVHDRDSRRQDCVTEWVGE